MVLPDLLKKGLFVVFCGTRAGKKSARLRRYYAGPGNQFWSILYRVGLTPRQLLPAEYHLLPQFGIGLTDLIKTSAGGDRGLRRADFGGACLQLDGFILQIKPRILAFNGKRAAEVYLGRSVNYGVQPERVGKTRIVVLPSTSGAARGYWDEVPWKKLGLVRAVGLAARTKKRGRS